MKYLVNIYTLFLRVVSMPAFLAEYFDAKTGREYGVGFWQKWILLWRMIRNKKKIQTASDFLEHITIATQILNIPKSIEGCVVECGCFKGGSTANLSLVCQLCNRSLEVFDSFSGLPEPDEADRVHSSMDRNKVDVYKKGAYCGSLEEVKGNISQYGAIEVCQLRVGYFQDTLPHFKKKSVLMFLDVDLRASLETCVIHLWPLLAEGGYLFTHEAQQMEIASLFFDREWWQQKLHTGPPGLVGAGCGIGLLPRKGAYKSCLGYAVKNLQQNILSQQGASVLVSTEHKV